MEGPSPWADKKSVSAEASAEAQETIEGRKRVDDAFSSLDITLSELEQNSLKCLETDTTKAEPSSEAVAMAGQEAPTPFSKVFSKPQMGMISSGGDLLVE